jgi:hypothetical protein
MITENENIHVVLDTGQLPPLQITPDLVQISPPRKKVTARIKKIKPTPPTDITYREFFKEGKPCIDFHKYKIPDLKQVARTNRLLVGGNKYDLMARIECHFYLNLYAEKIQTAARGFFARRMRILRGPAYGMGTPQCVNETDFYTMEPLVEIPKQQFFSYTGEDGFTYGFDINSFIDLLKNRSYTIQNPYNRSNISMRVILNAIHLYFYMILYVPSYVTNEDNLEYVNTSWLRLLHNRCMNQIRYDAANEERRRRSRRVLPPTIMVPVGGGRGGGGEDTPRTPGAPRPRRRSFGNIFVDEEDEDDDHPPRTLVRTADISVAQLRDLIVANQRNQAINTIMNSHIRDLEDDLDDLPPLIDPENSPPRPRSPTTVMEPPSTPPSLRRNRRSRTDLNTMVSTSPGSPDAESLLEHLEGVRRKLAQVRGMNVTTRVQELFMEMDQLGNYTDTRWFTDLNKRSCFYLYGHMLENWNHRSRLTTQVRGRICPLGSPFQGVLPNNSTQIDDFSTIQLILGCLTVMENMVYTAYDVEDRKLGAFHVLTALTAVSQGAREMMPWLYESIYYD